MEGARDLRLRDCERRAAKPRASKNEGVSPREVKLTTAMPSYTNPEPRRCGAGAFLRSQIAPFRQLSKRKIATARSLNL